MGRLIRSPVLCQVPDVTQGGRPAVFSLSQVRCISLLFGGPALSFYFTDNAGGGDVGLGVVNSNLPASYPTFEAFIDHLNTMWAQTNPSATVQTPLFTKPFPEIADPTTRFSLNLDYIEMRENLDTTVTVILNVQSQPDTAIVGPMAVALATLGLPANWLVNPMTVRP